MNVSLCAKMHLSFCPVYYLKATFGSAIGDAVLSIPVSVNGSDNNIWFYYTISSPRIHLIVYQRKADNSRMKVVFEIAAQEGRGEWSTVDLHLEADVVEIELVAHKTGVTLNVQYVLVDVIQIFTFHYSQGIISLLHYMVFVIMELLSFFPNVFFILVDKSAGRA